MYLDSYLRRGHPDAEGAEDTEGPEKEEGFLGALRVDPATPDAQHSPSREGASAHDAVEAPDEPDVSPHFADR